MKGDGPILNNNGIIVRARNKSNNADAPFSAGFIVERNRDRVGQFRSDASGHFTVWLSPGAYRVIPNPDAPLSMTANLTTMMPQIMRSQRLNELATAKKCAFLQGMTTN